MPRRCRAFRSDRRVRLQGALVRGGFWLRGRPVASAKIRVSMQASRTFPHAMLREIYEQPEALAATMARYAPSGVLDANAFAQVAEALRGRQRVVIAASGSSRHAGLAGEIMLEDYAGLAVDVEYSSEYMYRSTHTLHDPGVVVISQSGETADTLASLREAKVRGLAT